MDVVAQAICAVVHVYSRPRIHCYVGTLSAKQKTTATDTSNHVYPFTPSRVHNACMFSFACRIPQRGSDSRGTWLHVGGPSWDCFRTGCPESHYSDLSISEQ